MAASTSTDSSEPASPHPEAHQAQRSGLGSWGLAGARALLGAALALALFELIVRRHYTLAARFEPGLGYVTAPGVVRWSREGHGVTYWAEHGVRAASLPTAERKVLVLGDSFTEAMHVAQNETFTQPLEQMLTPRGVAVLNAGRSTSSTADYVARAPYYRATFSPVWTVIALSDADFTTDAFNDDPTRNRFSWQHGELALSKVEPEPRAGLSALQWEARQRSMLIGYAAVRLGELGRAAAAEPPLFFAGSERHAPPAPAVDYPIEAVIDSLRAAYDGKLTVLYLPSFDPTDLQALSPVEQRVMTYCEQKGLSCATPRPYFGALLPEGAAPYGFSNSSFNAGHMNARGHALCGKALVNEFNRLVRDAVL